MGEIVWRGKFEGDVHRNRVSGPGFTVCLPILTAPCHLIQEDLDLLIATEKVAIWPLPIARIDSLLALVGGTAGSVEDFAIWRSGSRRNWESAGLDLQKKVQLPILQWSYSADNTLAFPAGVCQRLIC
jgi:hypothetical protein